MTDSCLLYVMVADAGGTLRHFKIGIAADITSRLSAIQVGCPLPITEVLAVRMKSRADAAAAEKRLHATLADYRTSGEWFQFDMSDADHKLVFKTVTRCVLDEYLGANWKWQRESVTKYRAERREVNQENVTARRRNRPRLVAHAIRLRSGMPMW